MASKGWWSSGVLRFETKGETVSDSLGASAALALGAGQLRTTNNITFYDTTLTLSSTNFVETPGLNNGSVNTTNTFTLANDTFSQAQTTRSTVPLRPSSGLR